MRLTRLFHCRSFTHRLQSLPIALVPTLHPSLAKRPILLLPCIILFFPLIPLTHPSLRSPIHLAHPLNHGCSFPTPLLDDRSFRPCLLPRRSRSSLLQSRHLPLFVEPTLRRHCFAEAERRGRSCRSSREAHPGENGRRLRKFGELGFQACSAGGLAEFPGRAGGGEKRGFPRS
jgi:hypothetical protein